MKISISVKCKKTNNIYTHPFEFNLNFKFRGKICSFILYGDLINNPEFALIYYTLPKPSIPKGLRQWVFIDISWSEQDGFEFTSYSDPEIITSLNGNVGSLQGIDKININNGLIGISFKAEVNQSDLANNDPKLFLEKCSLFGIQVTDIEFKDIKNLYKLYCPNSHLYNVTFSNSDLEFADFTNSKVSHVEFINSNLKNSNFSKCQFCFKVEFSKSILIESIFDYCKVEYNKSRIENEEILLFSNKSDLTGSRFFMSTICCKFENVDLSKANFLEAKLVASKFNGCILNETIFTKSLFASFDIAASKNQKQNSNNKKLITCCILPLYNKNKLPVIKGDIINCKFDSASMTYIDMSDNKILDTDFENANLSRSKLHNCEFIRTQFHGKKLNAADLSYADTSFSIFKESCNLNAVKFYRARMIETKIEKSELIKTNFLYACLRSSYILDSNLTGADFRYADLTLMSLDKCYINCAKFFQTQRGGLQLKIKVTVNNESENKTDKIKIYDSGCYFECIDWSPKGDGEIQIDKNSFLSIVNGDKSPVAVISNLSKEGAQFILNTYASATAKNAGDDYNDASVNIGGDVNESEVEAGVIENDEMITQSEDDNQESDDVSPIEEIQE